MEIISTVKYFIDKRKELSLKIKTLDKQIDDYQVITNQHMLLFGFDLITSGLYERLYSKQIDSNFKFEILLDISQPNKAIIHTLKINLTYDKVIDSTVYDNILYLENYSIVDKNIIEEEINKGIQNNFVYYRVKNTNNREHTDLMIYNYLLKTIYNIS